MSIRHQSSSAVQVLSGPHRALRLHGVLALQARTGGSLQVRSGQVWITRSGDAGDHVLQAGDSLCLGRGEQAVAEPWRAGQAADLLWLASAPAAGLVALPAAALAPQGLRGAGLAVDGLRAGALRTLAHGLRGAAGRLSAAARSAESMARRAQGCMASGASIASSGTVQ